MKPFTLLSAVILLSIVCVCNNTTPLPSQQQKFETLPFKLKTNHETGRSGIIADSIDTTTSLQAYQEKIRKVFGKFSTITQAFEYFKKELPNALQKGDPPTLFVEFFNCDAFDSEKNTVANIRSIQKEWVKMACAEKDENIRMLYAQYVNEFNDVRYHYFVESMQIRPGEEFRLHGYHYNDDNDNVLSRRINVEIAMLILNKQLKPDGFTPVHKDSAKFEDGYRYKMNDPGVYRITIWGEEQFAQFYVQVSWLDCVVKADSKGILTFGSSFKDTIPPPYKVHFVNTDGEVYTSKTDSKGALFLKHQFGDSGSSSSIKILLEKNGQLAFMENFLPTHRNDTTIENYIYTDRPVYRPGDRVHFHGILKLIVNASAIVPAIADSVDLLITDPQGITIWRDTIAVDKWGHFGDSVTIDPSNKQGRYNIQYQGVCNTNGQRSIYYRRNYLNSSFLVDSYKKPEFVISIKPEKEVWFIEEEPVIKIKGEYYFGGALADIPVKVRWYRQTMGHYFNSWGKSRCVFYPTSKRQFLKQEEVRLNKTGELNLKWKPDTESDTPYGYIIAEVIATDQSRREVRGESKVQIVKYDAYLAVIPDKYEYEVKDSANIEIIAVDMKGDALTGNVSLRIKKDGGIISDEQLPISKSGRLHFKLDIKESGMYTIDVSAADRRGKIAFVEHSFTVVKKRTWNWNWERIEITTDKKQYIIGDTAYITVKSGADKTRALCTVEGQCLNEWKVDSLKDYTLQYHLPITAPLGPNIQFNVTFSASSQMAYSSYPLTIIDSSCLLSIKLNGNKFLKPGETFSGALIVSDRTGKPSAACMSVALVDEAIFDVSKVLEQSGIYGYNCNRSWYFNQNHPEGLLSIIPSWYGNFVRTSYNRFDQNFLLSLSSISQQHGNSTYARCEPVSSTVEAPPPGPMLSTKRNACSKQNSIAMSGDGRFAADIDAQLEKAPSENKYSGCEPPRERKEFKDLGYWNPALIVDANGRGKLSFTMPDDLTKWRLILIGSDGKAHLAEFKDSLVTKQDIMAKLEAPRGFVVDDTTQVSTVIHNYTEKQIEAKVSLEIKAGSSKVKLHCNNQRTVSIKSNGTERVDWPLTVLNEGPVSFTTSVISTAGSDAESRTYPIRVHGIPKVMSETGILSENNPQIKVSLPSPKKAAPGSRTLTIEYAPSLAYSLFESLEYLTGFPYGCVEQTMNRFLPNLYVAGVMKRLDIHNDSLIKMIPEYTNKGLERLHKLQHNDGGWGWWESDSSDPRMTALVLYGLSYALKADISIENKKLTSSMIERGVRSAISQMKQYDKDALLLAQALCAVGHCRDAESVIMKIYNKRGNLSSYELALLLESLTFLMKKTEISKVVELLETKASENSGTVFWSSSSSEYVWYRQNEETTARVIRALISVNPNHPLLPKAVNWLSQSKRDGYWVSTKTTAIVIEALSYYIEKSGEFDPDYTLVIKLNEKIIASTKVNRSSLKTWTGKIIVADSLIGNQNYLQFTMKGKGRLYYSTHIRYASNERPVKASSNDIFVNRNYTRLVYKQNNEGDWKVSREPFDGTLLGGDELEVTVTVKNNLPSEYMLLEDYFPSGMEILHKEQDWYSRWCGYWWYGYNHSEARDDRMVWFVSSVGEGQRTFRYLLRAETPGVFIALPARAELMYQPEICGNSDESTIRIKDAR
jgi:uncharacterized protein YfaS (alpha-2-macroglobulin family)